MRIMQNIEVKAEVHYLDIEGLRTVAQYGSKRGMELHNIYAQSRVNPDGSLVRVHLTAAGKFIKKDGTVGEQSARIRFGSLDLLPEDWQERIVTDLRNLSGKVTVSE